MSTALYNWISITRRAISRFVPTVRRKTHDHNWVAGNSEQQHGVSPGSLDAFVFDVNSRQHSELNQPHMDLQRWDSNPDFVIQNVHAKAARQQSAHDTPSAVSDFNGNWNLVFADITEQFPISIHQVGSTITGAFLELNGLTPVATFKGYVKGTRLLARWRSLVSEDFGHLDYQIVSPGTLVGSMTSKHPGSPQQAYGIDGNRTSSFCCSLAADQ